MKSKPRLVANYHSHFDDVCSDAYIQKSHLIFLVREDKPLKFGQCVRPDHALFKSTLLFRP